MGGAGITNFENIHPYCWAASFNHFINFSSDNDLPPQMLNTAYADRCKLINPFNYNQKALCIDFYKASNDNLIQSEQDPEIKLWLTNSSNKMSSLWIYDYKNYSPNQIFSLAFKLKLAITIPFIQEGQSFACICNQTNSNAFSIISHALGCNAFSQLKTNRHTKLVRTFRDLLSFKYDFGETDLFLEPNFHVPDPNSMSNKILKGDLRWITNFGINYFLEFSFTSKLNQLLAIEKEKSIKYLKRIENFKLLPIIIDTTAKLSPETIISMKAIKENAINIFENSISKFLFAISSIVWYFNGLIIEKLITQASDT